MKTALSLPWVLRFSIQLPTTSHSLSRLILRKFHFFSCRKLCDLLQAISLPSEYVAWRDPTWLWDHCLSP